MKQILTIDSFNMVNKDPKFKHTVDFDTLCEATGLEYLQMDYSRFNDLDSTVTCYYIFPFNCYDQFVGMRHYYLNGEPLAVSIQSARKSDEDFTFASKNVLEKLRSFLKSISSDPYNDKNIEFFDSNDVLITYEDDSKPFPMKLNSSNSFIPHLHLKYAYHENHKLTSFDTVMNENGRIDFDQVLIQREDGATMTVSIKDIDITLNINHPDVP